MKHSEIQIGAKYWARVNRVKVPVIVENILDGGIVTTTAFHQRQTYRYYVTNMATKRKTVFYSAAKFVCRAIRKMSREEWEGKRRAAEIVDSKLTWEIGVPEGRELATHVANYLSTAVRLQRIPTGRKVHEGTVLYA